MDDEFDESNDLEKSNGLSSGDPYNAMLEDRSKALSPDFGRDQNKSAAANNLSAAEKESANSKKAGAGSGLGAAKKAEKSPNSLYSGGGKGMGMGVGGRLDAAKKVFSKIKGGKGAAAGVFIAIIIVLALVPIGLFGLPIWMIGQLDSKLQETLGFDDTMATLETEVETVTQEQATAGFIPKNYAQRLADAGVEVGQVTASGEFVRTNQYIANLDDIEDLSQVAAISDYRINGDKGELSFLFDGQIIKGGDFIAAMNSNPKLYAAVQEGADIVAKFYYSKEVNQVYQDMGLSRSNFRSWESTGNEEEDQKNFEEILKKVLNKEYSMSVAGCAGEDDCSESDFSGDDAGALVESVADSAGGTEEAAQLLNAAVSGEEPYRAARAFLAVVEPIEWIRIDGEGPIHETMDTLYARAKITYTDAVTGETVVEDTSIIECTNFGAAVSDNVFSRNEASSFGRDRILMVTQAINDDTIKKTGISSSKSTEFGIATGKGSSVDKEVLKKATSGVSIGSIENDYELFNSVVGCNRAVEGGAFLNGSINSHTLGAMASDATAVGKYHQETKKMLAKKAAADRATLSPFDISSPNTFLGSIASNFASSFFKHTSRSNSLTSAINTVTSFAGSSTKNLFGQAIAAGDDEVFTTMAGDCYTVPQAENTEGDLYCNAHHTISTKYIRSTGEDFDKAFKAAGLDDSDKEDFVAFAMDRDATVGINSADICERYREKHLDGIVDKIFDGIKNFFGVYKACDHEDLKSIGSGAYYTLSDTNTNKSNVELYSGYALYDMVSSLLKEEQSDLSKVRENYYARYPKDNSEAGRLARISGLTKEEAQIALAYKAYLTRIANYNPNTRFAFGASDLVKRPNILIDDSNRLARNTEYLWLGRIEYADVRNRTFTT